jgi:lipopolysaccharide transport system permease protein
MTRSSKSSLLSWSFIDPQSLDFLRAMTSREIKARYKHAVLGFLWVVLNPLLQMAIMGFVFRFFVPVQVDNYFLYLFTGLLPWMFFSLSLTKATPAIMHEKALVQKANFPREIIVLAIVLSNLFHFAVSLVILLVLLVGDKLLFEGYSLIELVLYVARILWVIPLMVWLGLLTTGLSLLTSALNVKYRDINFLVQALVPLWFYATPIVYSLKLLPEYLYPLFYLNPVTAIVEGFQWALLKQQPGSIDLALMSLVVTSLIVYLGVWVFNEEKKWFDDWF